MQPKYLELATKRIASTPRSVRYLETSQMSKNSDNWLAAALGNVHKVEPAHVLLPESMRAEQGEPIVAAERGMSAPATATIAPHNLEAEVSVLGACLQDAEAARKATEILTAADFFSDANAELFGAIQSLVARGIPPDLVTVYEELRRRGTAERAGGSEYLARLVDAVPTAAHVAHHARLVREKADLRHLVNACTRTAEQGKSDGADLPGLVAQLRESLERIGAPTHDHSANVVCLADVTPEAVSWLWPGRFPRGKLSLLIGDPGEGKSCVMLDMAARVSGGLAWPDGGAAPLGGVVLLTAEDGLADTIRPRLDAMNADPSRVVALQGIKVPGEEVPAPFRLAEDIGTLESVIKQTAAALVVVDPVSAYLGKADSYKDAEIRGVLAPLAAMAERTGVAVVAIMHLTKDTQRKVLYRAQGNIAFAAAARAVFAVAEDPENPQRRLLLPVKNNLVPKPPGLAFRLIPAGGAVRVEWDADPVTVDADAALAGPELPQERGAREEAKEFLVELLASGPVPSEDVKRQARAADIAERTLSRAKAELGVKAVHVGGLGTSGCWEWELPSGTPKAAKTATPADTGNGGKLGNLSVPEVPAEVEAWEP